MYLGSTRFVNEPPPDEDMESAKRELSIDLASFIGWTSLKEKVEVLEKKKRAAGTVC
jgi:hypothetical protein